MRIFKDIIGIDQLININMHQLLKMGFLITFLLEYIYILFLYNFFQIIRLNL
jgi:hypothetical protein